MISRFYLISLIGSRLEISNTQNGKLLHLHVRFPFLSRVLQKEKAEGEAVEDDQNPKGCEAGSPV